MKQKTLFKIIILALCIIVLFFVFDKDNNASDNINNISKTDLALKYDKNDDRLESLFDAIDNEENVGGRVLVINPKPKIPISSDLGCMDDAILFCNSENAYVSAMLFDFSYETDEFEGLDLFYYDYDGLSEYILLSPTSFDGVGKVINYQYYPFFVLPGNVDKMKINEGLDKDSADLLRIYLDEILLITKESIITTGGNLYEENI